MKISSVSDIPISFAMLIYGPTGSGKTVLAGSASAVQEMSPVLVVSPAIERGFSSLRKKVYLNENELLIDPKNISVLELLPYVEPIDGAVIHGRKPVIKQLEDLVKFLGKGSDYKTLILDSLSHIYLMMMRERLAVTTKGNKSIYDTDWSDWRVVRQQIIDVLSSCRLLQAHRNLNFIVTSIDKVIRENSEGLDLHEDTWIGVHLPGQLSSDTPPIFDIVGLLRSEPVPRNKRKEGGPINYRALITSAESGLKVKDRSWDLPRVLPDPTMRKIYDAVKGE